MEKKTMNGGSGGSGSRSQKSPIQGRSKTGKWLNGELREVWWELEQREKSLGSWVPANEGWVKTRFVPDYESFYGPERFSNRKQAFVGLLEWLEPEEGYGERLRKEELEVRWNGVEIGDRIIPMPELRQYRVARHETWVMPEKNPRGSWKKGGKGK